MIVFDYRTYNEIDVTKALISGTDRARLPLGAAQAAGWRFCKSSNRITRASACCLHKCERTSGNPRLGSSEALHQPRQIAAALAAASTAPRERFSAASGGTESPASSAAIATRNDLNQTRGRPT